MAIYKKWLACIGIDGARLTVGIDSDSCCRGDTLSGTVRLDGGAARQCIERIGVDFGQWGDGFTKYASLVVATQITVEPRATHTFAYTLQVPPHVPISNRGPFVPYAVRLNSNLLRGGLRGEFVNIIVLPEAEIMVMDEALQSLGFLPDKSNLFATVSLLGGQNTFVKQTYSAPDAVQEQITRVTLHLGIVDDHLQGHLLLSQRQMPNLTALKVFTGGHQQRLGIDIPRAVLLGENGRAHAVSEFQRLLSEALVFPHNPQNWLLRGANKPPESQETLLRPAHGVAAEEQETLLRSAPESDP